MKLTITLDPKYIHTVIEREPQSIFADALYEFVSHRSPVVDYVNNRYPDTIDYSWLNRDGIVAQVNRRIGAAKSLHNAVLGLKVEGGF